MKKIIRNKVYDTGTATLFAEYSSGHSETDSKHYTEALYQKKTGEYFIYGEGGSASRYSQACPTGGWQGGEKIVPLSYEQARQWAEEYLSTQQYEKLFGEVAEDEDRVTMSISLSASEAAHIRQAAAKAGMSISAYIVSKVI